MNKILMALAVAAIALPAQLRAEDVRLSNATSSGSLTLLADSVDFRSDLTRVYGRLSGRPHTSNRIDFISVRGSEGAETESSDIDGVDMKRWFQWEDDGIIPVEIDFPAMKPQTYMVITVQGPRGESIWKITNRTKKSKKRK
ncbi:MAG: hypothetical protein K2M85_00695 [Paramuribaculum sp.]|nr:hypothetical protein [Paramuribaculum sp.]